MGTIVTFRGSPIFPAGNPPTGIAWDYRGSFAGPVSLLEPIRVPASGGSSTGGSAVAIVSTLPVASGGAVAGFTYLPPDGAAFLPPGFGRVTTRAAGRAAPGLAAIAVGRGGARLSASATVDVAPLDSGPATLREAVFALLSDSAELTAVVGPRVFHGRIPQRSSFPAVVFTLPSSDHGVNLGGGDGTATATVQIDCWASRPDQSEDAAEAVRMAFHGRRGTVGTVDLLRCLVEDVGATVERSGTGLDDWTYRHILMIDATHRVRIPAF